MKKEGCNFEGDIPVLNVSGNGIAEAWENSVVELYNKGAWYSRAGPKDKGQLHVDSTMTIEIKNPDSSRFMHKYVQFDFTDMIEYEMEMLGAKNSLVHDSEFDPEGDTRWNYHYAKRFLAYPGFKGDDVNQIEAMVKGLSEEPWKRRNHMVTWVPEEDSKSDDPPCLQSVWAYIAPAGDDLFKLNMDYTFRSRNVMRAAPQNMKGMHVIQSYLRDEVIENTGMKLVNGRLCDHSFSYHVSAQDQPELQGFMKRFDKALRGETRKNERTIDDRCFDEEFINEQYESVRPGITDKIIGMVVKRHKERFGSLRKNELDAEIYRVKQISESRRRYPK